MKFFSAVCLATLATALTPDAQKVYDDISGIDGAVRDLTSVLQAYTGGIQTSSAIFNASLAIHAVNRQGFADAVAASNFTSPDSKQIVQRVNDTVGVSIPQSVQVIESKKPLFDDADLTSLVKATIDLLKGDHETFSLAVGAKLSLDHLVPGALAAGAIDASLQGASLYFAL